jgi:hypothetical protein
VRTRAERPGRRRPAVSVCSTHPEGRGRGSPGRAADTRRCPLPEPMAPRCRSRRGSARRGAGWAAGGRVRNVLRISGAILLIVSVVGTVGFDVESSCPGSRRYATSRSTPVYPTSSRPSHRGAIRHVASSAMGRVGRTHSRTSPRIRAEDRWPSGSTSCETTAVPSRRGTAVAF